MSHSAEKGKRGAVLDLLPYVVAKFQKTRRADPLGTLKFFRKVEQRRKNPKGGL